MRLLSVTGWVKCVCLHLGAGSNLHRLISELVRGESGGVRELPKPRQRQVAEQERGARTEPARVRPPAMAGGQSKVGSGPATAGFILVHEVVMDQRERVEHLQRSRRTHHRADRCAAAGSVPADHTQQRSDPLTAREEEPAELFDEIARQPTLGSGTGPALEKDGQVGVKVAADVSQSEQVDTQHTVSTGHSPP